MTEFDLIRRYFTRATPGALLGVGDDAALLKVSSGNVLAVSSDMLVCGTHFFPDADPFKLGHKTLAVNLSDMAAMGATPRWATLAISLPYSHGVDNEVGHGHFPHPNPPPQRVPLSNSLPQAGERTNEKDNLESLGEGTIESLREFYVNDAWLEKFSAGFFALAQQYGVELVGGDTTRGTLSMCVTIFGEVDEQQALRRSGAQPGDEVWVSGTLGDAALVLAHLQGRIVLSEDEFIACAPALHQPQPRVALGLVLRGIATSAIDLSDGLLGDLGHILDASQVGAEIELALLPISAVLRAHLTAPNLLLSGVELLQRCVLSGGDDYELCFTAPVMRHAEVLNISARLALPLTCIGKIVVGCGCVVRDASGNPINAPINVEGSSYDHFR